MMRKIWMAVMAACLVCGCQSAADNGSRAQVYGDIHAGVESSRTKIGH